MRIANSQRMPPTSILLCGGIDPAWESMAWE
jgi:hypothetical protein